jgi:hypothetical protein
MLAFWLMPTTRATSKKCPRVETLTFRYTTHGIPKHLLGISRPPPGHTTGAGSPLF